MKHPVLVPVIPEKCDVNAYMEQFFWPWAIIIANMQLGEFAFRPRAGQKGRVVANGWFKPANERFGTSHPPIKFNLLLGGMGENNHVQVSWYAIACRIDLTARDLALRRFLQVTRCIVPILEKASPDLMNEGARLKLREQLEKILSLPIFWNSRLSQRESRPNTPELRI